MFNKAKTGSVSGFTVIEVLIVVVVASIITPVVIISLGNYYRSAISTLGNTAQDTDTQSALNMIASDLKNTAGFRASLSVAGVNPLGSTSSGTGNGTWSYCGTSYTAVVCDGNSVNDFVTNRVLIAYTYATDGPAINNQRLPVFVKDSAPSFDMSSAKPATNAYIYFVARDRTNPSRNNLYRRTIVDVDATTNVFRNISAATGLWSCSTSNPGYVGCSTPYQKTSCATNVASSYPICRDRDIILLHDIKSFWIDYYRNNQAIANVYSSGAATAAAAATDIQNNATSIRITISKKSSTLTKKTSTATLQVSKQ